jgi:hypothetical protein
MEIHHPHVEKKGFKDYLLEGFMIFIAVTMGFFAENLRERIYNHEREKEYISSLLNNLQEDRTSLDHTIWANEKKVKGLDSLLSLDVTGSSQPSTRYLLYTYCHRYVSYYSGFSSNDATMMQLKNAGGFEYIKDHAIADSIANYDIVIRNIYAAETAYGRAIERAIDAMSEVLILTNNPTTTYSKNGMYNGKRLPLLNNDPTKMQIFLNRIDIERAWTENYVHNLKETLKATTRAISLLKNKYRYK